MHIQASHQPTRKSQDSLPGAYPDLLSLEGIGLEWLFLSSSDKHKEHLHEEEYQRG